MRGAITHEPRRLDEGFHTHRVELLEVERTDAVIRADLDLALEQDRAGIDALVDPENRQPGARLSGEDRPVHGGAPAGYTCMFMVCL